MEIFFPNYFRFSSFQGAFIKQIDFIKLLLKSYPYLQVNFNWRT